MLSSEVVRLESTLHRSGAQVRPPRTLGRIVVHNGQRNSLEGEQGVIE
jgi:hypothetical protein